MYERESKSMKIKAKCNKLYFSSFVIQSFYLIIWFLCVDRRNQNPPFGKDLYVLFKTRFFFDN